MLTIPGRRHEGPGAPDDVIVYHHDRHARGRQRFEVLLNPRCIAIGQPPERCAVGPRRQQEHLPTEDLDQPGDQRDVDAGHVHQIGGLDALLAVVLLKALGQRRTLQRAIDLPWIERKHLFGRFERARDRFSAVGAAGIVLRVPHVRPAFGQVITVDQRGPAQIEVPGFHEGIGRPLPDLLGAVRFGAHAGYDPDQIPIAPRRELGARDPRWHLQVNGCPTVSIRHAMHLSLNLSQCANPSARSAASAAHSHKRCGS